METESNWEYEHDDVLQSKEDSDFNEYEAAQKKHGLMFAVGYIMEFLTKYPDEETFSEDTRRFLKQVRETSGYEVDCHPDDLRSPFIPYEPGRHPFVAEMLADVAVKSINKELEKDGECYDLVRVERYIDTHEVLKLLTLSVKDGGGTEKRLRACVMQCWQPELRRYLREWKLLDCGEDEGWRVVGDKTEEGQVYNFQKEEEEEKEKEKEKEKEETFFVLVKVRLGGGDGGKDSGMVVVAKVKKWNCSEEFNEKIYNLMKKDGHVDDKGSILRVELLESSNSSIYFFGKVKRRGMLNVEEGKEYSSVSVFYSSKRLEKFKTEFEGMRNDMTKDGILVAEKGSISGPEIYDILKNV